MWSSPPIDVIGCIVLLGSVRCVFRIVVLGEPVVIGIYFTKICIRMANFG